MRIATMLAVMALVASATPVVATTAGPGGHDGLSSSLLPWLVEVSAAKRKKHPSSHRAYNRAGTQIACTRWGCRPIPRGCRIETEYNPWTWNPSGFDAVICPAR